MLEILNFSKKYNLEKGFFKTLFSMAVPIALQNVIQSLVIMVDNQMVSSLGEDSLASVSLAGQVFFIVLLAFFGLASGASIFFSRYFGAKDDVKMRETLGLSMAIGLGIAFVSMAVSFYLADPIILLLSSSQHLTDLGSPFLKITALSMPMVLISIVLSSYFRSVFKSHYPMYISVFALFLDIVLNYLLIFGNFGMPKLGIAGAALATLIARFVEMILLIILFFSKKNSLKFCLHDYLGFLKPDTAELKSNFIKIIIPLIIADLNWVFAITIYKASYAMVGEGAVAAFTALDSIFQVFMVIFYGLGTASSTFIGKAIGEHKLDKVMNLGNLFIIINFLVAIPLSIILALMADIVPVWFSFSAETTKITKQAIYLCAIFLSFRTLEFFMTVGILRGGGDSKFFLYLQTITLWVFGVPVVFIMAKYFNASAMSIFLVVLIEEVIRDIGCYIRFKSGKWIHIFK